MYTMSHNGNKIMRENMHDIHLLLFFSKTYFHLNVCFISKTVKQYKVFRQKAYQTQKCLMEGLDVPHPLIKWYPNLKKSVVFFFFLIYQIKHIIHHLLTLFLWYVFSV